MWFYFPEIHLEIIENGSVPGGCRQDGAPKIHLRPKVLKTRKSNSLFNTSRGNYKPKRK